MRLKLLILVCLLSVCPALAQSAAIMPMPKIQILDSNGDPLASGHCHTYETGTTTPLATYTDATAGTPNANPVVLDSAGRADIWLGNTGAYTIDCDDSANVDVWSVDGVQHIGLLLKADLASTSDNALGDALVGMIQTGTGATARTVHAKFLESVSVKDYGALGNNANDDTAEIQAALDSLSSGGSLYLPAGTYVISSALTFSANTEFYGDGWSTVIKGNQASSDTRFLNTSGADNIIIRDLAVDCQNSATRGHQGIALFDGSEYVTVERIKITNCGQYGIVVSDTGTNGGAGGHTIRQNFVDMTGNLTSSNPVGIQVFPKGGASYLASPGVVVESNVVIGDANTVNGIKLNSQRGGHVSGNYVTLMTSSVSGNAGITAISSQGVALHDNFIYDVRTGMGVNGATGADNGLVNQHMKVYRNTIIKYTTDGILSEFGYEGGQYTDNLLDADTGGGTDGIELNAATRDYTDLIVERNVSIGGDIKIGSGAFAAPRASIRGNRVFQATGRAMDISGDDVSIVDNSLIESTTHGLLVTGDRALISQNHILDCNTDAGTTQSGIAVAGDYPVIIANHVEDPDGTGDMAFGITLTQGEGAILRDNTLTGMSQQDIQHGSASLGDPRSNKFFVNNAVLNAPSDTSENDMRSDTIPAGALGRFGGVRIKAAGTITGTNDTKTLKLYFGSTVVSTITEAAGETDDWAFDVEVWAATSESGQRAIVRAYQGAAIEQFDVPTSVVTDSTAAIIVKLTAQLANASDGINQRVWVVEMIN